MSLFICWSGERSGLFAEHVRDLLSNVLPESAPFLSSDIEKGTPWFDALSVALKRSRAALVCVTPDNAGSAWMHFEVGAIFGKQRRKRTFMYLLDKKATVLQGPFEHFQSSDASKEDTVKLLAAVGKLLNVPTTSWQGPLEKYWDTYAADLEALRGPSIRHLIPRFGEYLKAKTFNEAMHSCKDQGWVDRYARAKRTRDELMEARGATEGALTAVQKEQLHELVSELDGYLRALRTVVRDVKFPVSDAGVDFSQSPAVAPLAPESWIRNEAEHRRQRIRELTLLLEPSLAKS